MVDRPKVKHHHDWRTRETNLASLTYTKDQFLKLFTESPLPVDLNAPPELLSHQCLSPILSQRAQALCSNSRKSNTSKESLPEWYLEEASSPIKSKLKPEDIDTIEEQYSKVDVQYENSIKAPVEEDSKYPDWDDPNDEEEVSSISYPTSLISRHVKEGNPFASIIMTHSLHTDGQVILDSGSIPFEKVWFYKDPQNSTQGPFSTIEMFNWSAAGFFNSMLQIAHSSPDHFFSLQMYILQETAKQINNITKQ